MALMNGAPASRVKIEVEDLERIVARGRFGAVWKGKVQPQSEAHPGEGVAVKIFQASQQDRSSWQMEREIFELPRMEHDNILKFMGVDMKDMGGRKEYWLMTKFLDRGKCLIDCVLFIVNVCFCRLPLRLSQVKYSVLRRVVPDSILDGIRAGTLARGASSEGHARHQACGR